MSMRKSMMSLAIVAMSLVLVNTGNPIAAIADDDLEERIAELEATTARKGNRKVSMTISGHVNQAILYWSDGGDDDVYVVGNTNDDLPMFRFEGDAAFGNGWKGGYIVEIELQSAGSDAVDQTNDDGDQGVAISAVGLHFEHDQFGWLGIGLISQASDGVTEVDLSGGQYVGYSAIADVAGGFMFRLSNGAGLAGITIGELFDNLNGDTFDIVRYDTPTFAGFKASASWGEDDIWDVALLYAGEFGGFTVEGAISFVENTDSEGALPEERVDNQTFAGSFSIIHEATGLNFTFAAGERQFDNKFEDDAGNTYTPEDAAFYYFKAGIFQQFNSLGKTSFFGEYGHFDDMFNSGDADIVNALDTDAANACVGAGNGCIVNGSEAKVFGAGIVQYIDAAAMQVFIGYRHYEVDFDLVDINGNAVAANGIEDFDTVMAGARIEF